VGIWSSSCHDHAGSFASAHVGNNFGYIQKNFMQMNEVVDANNMTRQKLKKKDENLKIKNLI